MQKLFLRLICIFFFHSFGLAKIEFKSPIHRYYEKVPEDLFSKLKIKIEAGEIGNLRFRNELETLQYLLKEFEIPSQSQTLVFSNTSLQLSKITPHTPRAIYFSDDLYLGYVPNGQIEVIGIDPHVGAVPYIFEIPTVSNSGFPGIYRSRRCMNCHASEKTDFVPGLLLSSVIPMKGGGTLDVINLGKPGHHVAYEQRFGGWYLNHSNLFSRNWANSVGEIHKGSVNKIKLPNNLFNEKVPTNYSDPVAHLVLEHQIGFTNLCLKIQYLYRELIHNTSKNKEVTIASWVDELLEYILFCDEPRLPNPINIRLSPFAQEFQKIDLLRQFDLSTRLFRFRCSYLINGHVFSALPAEIQKPFWLKLVQLLEGKTNTYPKYSYLEPEEKIQIDKYLFSTNSEYKKRRLK